MFIQEKRNYNSWIRSGNEAKKSLCFSNVLIYLQMIIFWIIYKKYN